MPADVIQNVESNIEQFDNFIAVYIAFIATIDGLQDYVAFILKDVRQTVYKKLVHLPHCNYNCSKNSYNVRNWCQTCTSWKNELESHQKQNVPYIRVSWKETNSMDFPFSNDEISKCFIKDVRVVGRTFRGFSVLNDLGNLMSLFRNLGTCTIDIETSIKPVMTTRNMYFGHNYSAMIYEREKTQCIDALLRVLTTPSVQCHNSTKPSIIFLKKLRKSNRALGTILFRPYLQIPSVEAEEIQQNANLSEEDRKKLQDRLKPLTQVEALWITKKTLPLLKLMRKIWKYIFIYLPYILAFIYFVVGRYIKIDHFDDFLRLDLVTDKTLKSQFRYAEEFNQKNTVMRSWLAELLEDKFNTAEKGILLTADMGYGKSTIVSNILFAKENSPWHGLHSHVLSYHICKPYDNFLNHPGIFVQNLGHMIIRHIPQLGRLMYDNDIARTFLENPFLCVKDPFSCLDSLVLDPLRESIYEEKLMVIIDGIDQCNIKDKSQKYFVTFLKSNIDRFPQYFKFFFTSRNLTDISRKLSSLTHVALNSSNPNNINDVKELIAHNSAMSIPEINWFAEKAGNNIMIAKQFLLQASSLDTKQVPSYLKKKYETALRHAFRSDNKTIEALMPMFEILVALDEPIPEEELVSMINPDNVQEKQRIMHLIQNELRNFIRKSNFGIILLHKSITDVVTSSSCGENGFCVSKNAGHKRIAEYLLKRLEIGVSVSSPALIHHVISSESLSLHLALKTVAPKLGLEADSIPKWKKDIFDRTAIPKPELLK